MYERRKCPGHYKSPDNGAEQSFGASLMYDREDREEYQRCEYRRQYGDMQKLSARKYQKTGTCSGAEGQHVGSETQVSVFVASGKCFFRKMLFPG